MNLLYLNYMTYHRIKGSRNVRDAETDELIEPTAHDVFNIWADPGAAVRRDAYLTSDVTQADLSKYPIEQLQARLAYYERQYTFEQGKKARREFKIEMTRTEIELARRRMYTRKEADRVFAL
jgi:hypothetical protein